MIVRGDADIPHLQRADFYADLLRRHSENGLALLAVRGQPATIATYSLWTAGAPPTRGVNVTAYRDKDQLVEQLYQRFGHARDPYGVDYLPDERRKFQMQQAFLDRVGLTRDLTRCWEELDLSIETLRVTTNGSLALFSGDLVPQRDLSLTRAKEVEDALGQALGEERVHFKYGIQQSMGPRRKKRAARAALGRYLEVRGLTVDEPGRLRTMCEPIRRHAGNILSILVDTRGELLSRSGRQQVLDLLIDTEAMLPDAVEALGGNLRNLKGFQRITVRDSLDDNRRSG